MRTAYLLLAALACSGGKDGTEPTDSGTTDTTDTTDTTQPTGATGTDTGTPFDCDVEARDGTTRSCTDLVVFCDVSDANQEALDACIDCMGGFDDYYDYWQATLGTDFYATCATVELPDRPETCSPYTTGKLSTLAQIYANAVYGTAWTDGSTVCTWTAELRAYGPGVPLTVDSESELAAQLTCYDTKAKTVPVPQEALDTFDLATNRVHLFDANHTPWAGLYDTTLVFDGGCGEVSGVPPQVRVEAILVDRSVGVPDTVVCQLADCPAEVRDAPVPP